MHGRSHSGGFTGFCSGPHIIPIIYFIRIYDLDYYVSFTLTDFLEAKFRVERSVYGGDMLLDKLFFFFFFLYFIRHKYNN